jgi:hypothetical protein
MAGKAVYVRVHKAGSHPAAATIKDLDAFWGLVDDSCEGAITNQQVTGSIHVAR